ncbi:hypothetical protein HDU98_012078 [Podochytrium sp. JEL0797]|nr:hypothetical protein HDU98_012078 [Podochytrium sp. JEL0797]
MSSPSRAGSPTRAEPKKDFSVAIVGGGLVGALAAVYFAERGWQVTVFELREDIRTAKQTSGRSINLALSQRGISALQAAGVGQGLFDTLIPMRGRMLHVGGSLTSQNYGYFGEAINSIDRKLVNQHLLSMAEKHPNVSFKFLHEVLSIDFDKKVLTFKKLNLTEPSSKPLPTLSSAQTAHTHASAANSCAWSE